MYTLAVVTFTYVSLSPADFTLYLLFLPIVCYKFLEHLPLCSSLILTRSLSRVEGGIDKESGLKVKLALQDNLLTANRLKKHII